MKTLKADSKQRIRIPDIAPGQVLAYEQPGPGTFLLTIVMKVQKPERAVKPKVIERKGTHPVMDIGRPVTHEEIQKAIAEFP